ncbi:unnamed protein product [Owenia fusiformis]|uniref:Uncharacterized protein n=1 Tax=Owenia fusiformis TaxID=6347 RepID=A0A8J1U3U2_OWEFU|nr:unnamed protein product [Owenia fusiformis]
MDRKLLAQTLLMLLLFLLIHLPQGKATTEQGRSFRDSVEETLESLQTYEVTVPFLVNENGQFISFEVETHLPTTSHDDNISGRAKRSTQAFNETTLINLMFNLNDKMLQLQLHRDDKIVAPFATVEWPEGDITEASPIKRGCIYDGDIKDMDGSHALVDLCGGITGVLSTKEDDLFIKPLPQMTNDPRHPHAVYKVPVKNVTRDLRNDFVELDETIDHHRRQKRSRREDLKRRILYMETIVVADQSILRFHGKDVSELYLLTLMHVVNMAYRHTSLEIKIQLVVTRIVYLNTKQMTGLVVRGNAIKTLDRFCEWSNSLNNKAGHDFAIYITREEIGPAGYAPVTGMCNHKRSCAVNRDDGITSAFVIAHEIGHVLGMKHDGDTNDCDSDPTDGKIMAPTVQSTYEKHYWTSCSKDSLWHYMDTYTCLLDDPFEEDHLKKWPSIDEPFGTNWGLEKQCVQEFGKGHTLCKVFPDMDPCETLWCSEVKNKYLCKTKRGPPLPGTECGPYRWCMNSACVPKSDVLQDGAWSDWTSWSKCSRTCGMGARFRKRLCDNPPPAYGGYECEGSQEQLEMCNKQECPGGNKDYRAEQCTLLNDHKMIGNRLHTWLPWQHRNESLHCRLTCISMDTNDILTTRTMVTDGTFCNYDDTNMRCIRGECKKVGCNGVIGSDIENDLCGTCKGQNKDCQLVTGTYNKTPRNGYRKMLTLPKGAANIAINETKGWYNFIALQDTVDNEMFYLNGDTRQSYSRQFVVYGTRFQYHNNDYQESLIAKGPLLEPLNLMIYPVLEEKVKITYSYTAPNGELEKSNQIPGTEPRFSWEFHHWTNCTEKCGGGYEHSEYHCVEENSGEVADPWRCRKSTKPTKSRQCNTFGCTKYRWKASEYKECTATCGNGWQYRRIDCIKVQDNKEISLWHGYCNHTEIPESEKTCNIIPCPGNWHWDDWGTCSKSCGTGVQKRHVFCGHRANDEDHEYVCTDAKPPETRHCRRKTKCPQDGNVKSTRKPRRRTKTPQPQPTTTKPKPTTTTTQKPTTTTQKPTTTTQKPTTTESIATTNARRTTTRESEVIRYNVPAKKRGYNSFQKVPQKKPNRNYTKKTPKDAGCKDRSALFCKIMASSKYCKNYSKICCVTCQKFL